MCADIEPLKETRPVAEVGFLMGSHLLPIILSGLVQTASAARHGRVCDTLGVVVCRLDCQGIVCLTRMLLMHSVVTSHPGYDGCHYTRTGGSAKLYSGF